MFWWGPHAGWVFGLVSGLLWIALVIAAVLLLRQEIRTFDSPIPVAGAPGARGPVRARRDFREEFLERREVLLKASAPPPPPPPPTSP